MPLYTCLVRPGDLSPQQRAILAEEITRIHAEVTGAPRCFVQVFFREVAPGDGFVGGEPFAQASIVGLIRAGRSQEDKAKLLFSISQSWCQVTGHDERELFVGVVDVPAKNMMEDGDLLPEPGEEEAWLLEHGLAPRPAPA